MILYKHYAHLVLLYVLYLHPNNLFIFLFRKSGRHMKFPYTLSAKIAQFPFFFYIKNNIIWMYFPPAVAGAFYFIVQIHNLANSEANVKSWAETQRKIAEKEHH